MDIGHAMLRAREIADGMPENADDKATILAAALVWALLDLPNSQRIAHTLAHINGLESAGVLSGMSMSVEAVKIN